VGVNPDGYFGVELLTGPGTATELRVNGAPVADKAAGQAGVQSLPI